MWKKKNLCILVIGKSFGIVMENNIYIYMKINYHKINNSICGYTGKENKISIQKHWLPSHVNLSTIYKSHVIRSHG